MGALARKQTKPISYVRTMLQVHGHWSLKPISSEGTKMHRFFNGKPNVHIVFLRIPPQVQPAFVNCHHEFGTQ